MQETGRSTPKFPNNSGRQRSSNLASTDPEREFQQTALDSCRSTIAIQETELKRLKESMDVRNKQILQLEGQINHASSYISRRPSDYQPHNSEPATMEFQESLKVLHSKLDLLAQATSSPVNNNININNGHSLSSGRQVHLDKSVQTDLTCVDCHSNKQLTNGMNNHTGGKHAGHDTSTENIQLFNEELDSILTCTICGNRFETNIQLDRHLESTHNQNCEIHKCDYCESVFKSERELSEHIEQCHEAISPHICEVCGVAFEAKEHLIEHTETCHLLKPFTCDKCDYSCKTRNHLNYHSAACHNVLPADEPTDSNPSQTL